MNESRNEGAMADSESGMQCSLVERYLRRNTSLRLPTRRWMQLLLLLCIVPLYSFGQWRSFPSIHSEQDRFFQQWQFSSEAAWDSLQGWHASEALPDIHRFQRTPSRLRVMGWHPYWMGTRYKQYRYELLHTVAYFSYAVDPQTGSYKTIRQWKTTDLVPIAHQYGTRVVLCVTNFGSDANRQFLTNPQAKQVLIDSLIALVKLRNADGVNIDFELIPYPWLRDSLTVFLRHLADRFHQEIPGSEVSIALPAVDWYDVFDVAAYNDFLDYCVMMGYEYHWTGSAYAGPVAPLFCGTTWSSWCVDRSVSTYLAKGLRPEKLWLGVPYYGREWPVADTIPPAKATGSGTAYTYEQIVKHRLKEASWHWDESSMTPYYNRSAQLQGWYDDTMSLRLKYRYAQQRRLGGIGIWALGYDGDRPELWELLRETTTTAASESSRVSTGWHYLRLPDRILLYPPAPAALPVEVEVYTMLGQRIARERVAGQQPVVIPLPSATAQPIYLRIRTGNRSTTLVIVP